MCQLVQHKIFATWCNVDLCVLSKLISPHADPIVRLKIVSECSEKCFFFKPHINHVAPRGEDFILHKPPHYATLHNLTPRGGKIPNEVAPQYKMYEIESY